MSSPQQVFQYNISRYNSSVKQCPKNSSSSMSKNQPIACATFMSHERRWVTMMFYKIDFELDGQPEIVDRSERNERTNAMQSQVETWRIGFAC